MGNHVKYNYEGKVVLITGAASGLGLATATAFAESGSTVVLSDIRGEDLNNAVKNLKDKGYKASGIWCNVSDNTNVESMIEQVVSNFGSLDFAFNNAGIILPPIQTADISEKEWDRVISINLKGVWLCMKYELQQMFRQQSGVIINCSSMGGIKGVPGMSAYSASKYGIIGLTKSSALEYAGKGIRINAVCPGMVDTPMKNVITGGNEEMLSGMEKLVPIGRFCKPEEVAAAVLWLCSPDAGMVVGQALSVDGGITV